MKKLMTAGIALALAFALPAFAQTTAVPTPMTKPAPPATTPPAAMKAAPPATAPAATAKTPLIDINTASAKDLDLLPGIGPARAAAIIKSRETTGPYKEIGRAHV